ncbi:phospholipase D-like domain-containing protein [Anaerocolumna sp. AGMB13020]|uniref:phospholipase D-like domain-containing protein n=1 Tax=Anaerocolumna sp. AGMB13020 TaxID=3081750 RepID=UPI0029538E07|nr:phospholipase D-like domain-containing protein [Anaerocolumna sp. AGMB13020]WOO35800.1 phospholipase D-like domain-containing protein [Anaerocolumna sp. AGMB13020]
MSKIFRYSLSDTEFIAGEELLCFGDVLNDFVNAKYINILTYNISENKGVLLDAVKKAGARDIPIKIITNIPGRWPYYANYYRKKAAKNKIEIYERKLNPVFLGKLASVFFKFNNHGKIIMTDSIIYWGSANFSDESKKNYECGTLSRDKKFIEYVNSVIIPEVIKESTSYYDTEYYVCVMSMYSAIAYIHNMYDEIHEASYGYHESFTEEIEYFDFQNNYINWTMLTELMETINEYETILDDLIDDLESSEKEANYEELEKLLKEYNDYISSSNRTIVDLCYKLEKLARFDSHEYANDLLADDYASEAYEENLGNCVEMASNDAREVLAELIESSVKSILALLELLSEYEDTMLRFIDYIMGLANVNAEIDNTK